MSRTRLFVLLLFFLSGAAGLVYEVVWARQLSVIFGVSVFAVSTVLAAYMGGMALGSLLIGRRVDRHRNPVRTYAWLEIGIGLSALAVPLALPIVQSIFISLAPMIEGNFLLFNFARASLAIIPLLVPTTLMGGTVPAMAKFLMRHPDEFGWSSGLMYAVNTFGAVTGCLLGGFVLVPELGLSSSLHLAAAINVAIGAVLLIGRVGEGAVPQPPTTSGALEEASVPLTGSARLAIVVFALSGFAALGFEILWTRTLVLHVHNSTYAFTLMLSIFLAGLALGDALMIRFYDRLARPLLWLGFVQVAVGLSVIFAALAYDSLRTLSTGILQIENLESWGMAMGIISLRAAVVLLPSTILLGMTFPLVVRTVCGNQREVGSRLGMAYASNTAGAIAGSLGTAFVLIPWLGLWGALVLLAAMSIALGVACLFAETSGSPRARAAAVAAGLLVLLPMSLIPESLFRRAYDSDVWKLIFYKEGITDSTGVYEHVNTGERFVTYGDQRGTAATYTASVTKREAHIAHLLHSNPKKSLQIGFGIGNTLAAAAAYPEVEQLDCIELSSHIPDTAPYFWTNEGVLDDSRVNLIVDDGRNFLLRTREKYDVITLEPPEIFTAGVVNLYTREFYELAADALTDDGLVVNWIPTYTMGNREVKMLIASVLEVFPETSIWYQGALTEMDLPLTGMLLVVGAKQPIRLNVEEMERRMAQPSVKRSLEATGNPTPASLLWHYIAGPERLRDWVSDVSPVTDDKTVVDFSSATLAQAGFGFGFLRVIEHFGGVFRWRQLHDLATWKTFIRLRQPVAPLLVDSPGKGRVLDEIALYRREFDLAVREEEARLRKAEAARMRSKRRS